MWFIGAEVEQETSAPPPKRNPGSAPETSGQEPLNPIMALCMKVLKLFWPLVLTPVDQAVVECSPEMFGAVRLTSELYDYPTNRKFTLLIPKCACALPKLCM